jgi:tetratricopeptide (TPR) repeat protein
VSPGGYRASLATVLAAGAGARIAYVMALPGYDPSFARPLLDGQYYLDWARSLVAGGAGPGGAFYLAPLYPYLLAGFIRLFGENLTLLYLLQNATTVLVAALLAVTARRLAGDRAALAAASLVLLMPTPLFFASRPVGESLALLLLCGALSLAGSERLEASGVAGALAGLASLARPNLLLVTAVWAFADTGAKRWRHAACAVLGTALVLAPVALRNMRVSGHFVPVSSNAGMTLYHGNGPGATGGYTPPAGFSGRVATQRDEATTFARIRSGMPSLDPVEADRYWGRQAIRARLADPIGTLRLVSWRLLLLVDGYEHGLDDSPALDPNPWRRVAPVPFGWVLGMALAGLVLAGWQRTGGRIVWGAIAACAAAPVVFYAASRYRLPLAVVLCLPAGIGVAELTRAVREAPTARKTLLAFSTGLSVVLLSILVPSGELARSEEAGALANRVDVEQRAGDLDAALRTARAAVSLDPSNAMALYNLGVVLQAKGRAGEADEAYRRVLRLDAGNAGAAGNLASLLIAAGRPADAVAVVREALARGAGNDVCWNNLVVALSLTGDRAGAESAFSEASRRGVTLDPGLLRAVSGSTS